MGTFTEKDETAHRFVVDAKGKDKRGNGTAGATVTLTMDDAAGELDRRQGAHRPRDHRQAGPVRPRRDAGRLRQAARPVRRLPRAADGGGRRVRGRGARGRRTGGGARLRRRLRPGRSGRCRPSPPWPRTRRRPQPRPLRPSRSRPRPPPARLPAPARRPTPARGSDDALDLGKTVLPILVKAYWKPVVAAAGGRRRDRLDRHALTDSSTRAGAIPLMPSGSRRSRTSATTTTAPQPATSMAM